jgi:TonB family protein
MFARSGSYLIPSLMVHGVFFAALASAPATVESSSPNRAIEFITITDDGGGRVGDDPQIGDATEPAEPAEKIFRKVRPKPKPVRTPAVATPTPTPKKQQKPAEPIEDRGDADEEVHASSSAGSDHVSSATSHSMMRGSAGTDPNTTASGTGSGAEGIDRRSALRAWLREIQREVNKIATRNYPSSAVRMRIEGRLRLGITIGADGKILAVRVLSSSGHRVLDDSATASVHTLRIPTPPDALHWREREITLPIRYALD